MADKMNAPPKRGKYNWYEWADGDWWRIWKVSPEHPDGDFTCKILNFRTMAYKWADRHGYEVHTRVGSDHVMLCFYKEN